MNNHRKYKKRKLRTQDFSQQNHQEIYDDQQKLAADNLFNISDCYDHIDIRQVNPQSTIFNSVDILTNQQQKSNKQYQFNKFHPKSTQLQFNKIKTQKQSNKKLEEVLDKQFIKKSKNLLKLYSTQDNHQKFVESPSNKKKTQNIQRKKPKPSKKINPLFTCSSFKSDCVFVIKRKVVNKKTQIQKHKNRLYSLQSPIGKAHQERNEKENIQKTNIQKMNNTQYFIPHRNYFKSTGKKRVATEKKIKLDQEQQINNFRTLNSMKWLFLNKSIQKSCKSIKLTPKREVKKLLQKVQVDGKQIDKYRILKNKKHVINNRQEQTKLDRKSLHKQDVKGKNKQDRGEYNNTTFRKRSTLYKDIRNSSSNFNL